MAAQRVSFGSRASGADAVEERILAQRIDLLDTALPLAIVAVVLNGAVLGWLLLDRVPGAQLACWAGLVLVVSLFRWMVNRHIPGSRARDEPAPRLRWPVPVE